MIDEDGREAGPRALLPWALVAALAMLVVGLVASPWFEANVRSRLPGALHQPDVGAVNARSEQNASAIAALETRVSALESRPQPLPPGDTPALNDPAAIAAPAPVPGDVSSALVARIEALERADQRDTTRLDNLSAEIASLNVRLSTLGTDASQSIAAAAESAKKARGVLLVTAARRSAAEGQSLAVLEPALRRYFAADNATAVERLLDASMEAPTLPVLRQRFNALKPGLIEPASNGGSWWNEFTAGLADIVRVRRTTGDANQRRVNEMSQRLARGDVAGALVLFGRLPAESQRAGRDWRRDAVAYATVEDALKQLEAAVLLEDEDLPVTPSPTRQAPPAETTL